VGAGLYIWNFFRYAPRFEVTEQNEVDPRSGAAVVEVTEVRIST
jgi:hypothetical protein